MDLYRVLRPALFALPADLAHEASLWAFRRSFWRLLPPPRTVLDMRTSLGELTLRNPIGLAAGFDKNADVTSSMAALGFGFLVIGSVRPRAHCGNPRPWLVRRPEEDGLVNSMGLPSKGALHVLHRLQALKVSAPVLVSAAGEEVGDFVQVFRTLVAAADGWEVNLSCPNTPRGRTFEEDVESFEALLDALRPMRGAFLKLSPYEDEAGRERVLEIATKAVRKGFTNFTLCNTLPVDEARLGAGRGGLSGRPLLPLTIRAIRDFVSEFGERVSIIGVGGVTTGHDAFRVLATGARAVEVLTALVLRGPMVVHHILQELEAVMRSKGFESVEEVVGHAA